MNPFITKKNINLMNGKEPESKIEKIPSKIKLNSTETNEGLKQIKFLSKKQSHLELIRIRKIMMQKKERIQKMEDGP